MSKIVWFLDIDGVINSFPTPPQVTQWNFQNKTILGYSIWYAPELIAFIDSVHESGQVEVRWLTTWEHRANDDFAPSVGFRNRFEVEERQHAYGDYSWWKADQVAKFRQANPDTAIIWSDDDILFYPEAVNRALSGAEEVLALCPATNEGLNQVSLDDIVEFIGDHSV